MSGRWPKSWDNPSIEKMREVLKGVTLLIRVPGGKDKSKRRLHAINVSEIDPLKTNITCLGDVHWERKEIKRLKVRFAYPALVPIAGRYAGILQVTAEDIFGNISVEDLPYGTLVEVETRFVKIDHDNRLGNIWRPIIIVYDREVAKSLALQII